MGLRLALSQRRRTLDGSLVFFFNTSFFLYTPENVFRPRDIAISLDYIQI